MSRTENTAGKVKLTAKEKKVVDKAIRQAKGDGKPHTAQDTIPFEVMYPDGLCKLPGKSYSKTLAFQDINYQLARYVVEAVEKARKRRNVDKALVLHTDRGIQYVCKDYIKATEGMMRSYLKKGYPWDNACIESFHALIKREWLNRFKILNYDHAYGLVFQYIETFYNTVRIHSHCGYL